MLQDEKEKQIADDLEPGIIDDEMIGHTVMQGYKGESGRLARLASINLSAVTILRLEFQSKLSE